MTVQGETKCEIGKWQLNRGKVGLGALESRISLNVVMSWINGKTGKSWISQR